MNATSHLNQQPGATLLHDCCIKDRLSISRNKKGLINHFFKALRRFLDYYSRLSANPQVEAVKLQYRRLGIPCSQEQSRHYQQASGNFMLQNIEILWVKRH